MSNISQKLDLRQSQNLVMTPQLQQAIKLLQLNNVELQEFLEEEMERNPLLEKAEGDSEQSQDLVSPEDGGIPDATEEPGQGDMEAAFETSDEYQRSDFDSGSLTAEPGAGGNLKFDITDESFENRMSAEKTLREYLTQQLHMAVSDEWDRMIGALLIDSLDAGGYLRSSVSELSERLSCSVERIGNLLDIMKGFDPTGVFARDLSECLALQLEEQGKLDAPMKLLLNHLQLLADHDYKKLASLCGGVNETYLFDMIEEIKSLNPKPAAEFDHIVVQTAVPDVLMKRMPKNLGGGWRVELNSDTLPRVLINQDYFTQVSKHSRDAKDKAYVNEQMASANWLVRALDQRAQTILKVAAAIVEEQDAFFNYGIEFLRPLTLKDIAGQIEMHESTVSRVTTNKYIGTPRGLFELKFFFSTALISADGAVHSAEGIKARIKTLIDAEDPVNILSDDAIVDLLKAEGVDLARRTVAKYRETMHIGSSVVRRKQKKNRHFSA